MHPRHARAFAPLASALAHVGVLVFLLAASVPATGLGEGPADLGGEGTAASFAEPEPDFGPALVAVTAIGIVDDARVVAPVQAAVPPPAPSPAPAAPAERAAAAPAAPSPAERTAAVAAREPHPAVEAAVEADAKARGLVARKEVSAKKASGKGKSPTCPVVDDVGVERRGEGDYAVERELVDYYASHVKELMKLGSVRVNKDESGRPDGFRVGLARCSILREGGLRSGDVVKSVNGLVVHDLFSAVGAYLKLRRAPVIELQIERKGQSVTMRYAMV